MLFKNKIRFACLTVFAAFFLQDVAAQQRWSVGPRLGVNYSKLTGANPASTYVPGLAAGLYVMYSDINHFGLSADVLFSQKGGTYNYMAGSTREEFVQRVNYLEVPIVGRYFFNLKGNVRPNFFVGAAPAFRLNASQRQYERNDQSVNNVVNTASFRPFDLGLLGGLGINFKVSKARWVQADLRYQHSLLPVLAAANSPDRRNGAFSLMLGYAFGAGRSY